MRIGMILRSAMRRSLSRVLSLVIILWAQAGIATPPASGHGSKCHVRMVQAHEQAIHPVALATPLPGPHSMPCCPSHHPPPAPTQDADHPGCCDMGGQPARPLAFLVASGDSVSFQLSADGPAGTIFVAAPSGHAFLLSDD